MANTDTPTVRVGQVWADNDKRSVGRQVRVVEVDHTHATVELVARRGRPARGAEAQQRVDPGQQTKIRLDRFKPTSTGYRLVQDLPGSAVTPVPQLISPEPHEAVAHEATVAQNPSNSTSAAIGAPFGFAWSCTCGVGQTYDESDVRFGYPLSESEARRLAGGHTSDTR